MKALAHRNVIAIILLLGCCILFASLQTYLNDHSIITPDEFWFVHTAYHKYRLLVPYRDFPPYKSVLANYLFLLPMHFIHDPFYTFVWIKHFITAINTFFLFICSLLLARLYSLKAVLMSILLLFSTYFFINLTNDIRVDMFCYWMCLISVLLLLEEKVIGSGLTLGVAFCISQKALWYLLASNAGLLACWIIFSKSRRDLKKLMTYNLSMLSVIFAYLLIWSFVADFHSVFNHFIYEALIVYRINIYNDDTAFLQGLALRDNTLFLTLWIIAVISVLVVPNPTQQRRRVFVLIYTLTIILLLLSYQQAFGYYIIAIMPALTLLYVDFFHWVNMLSSERNSHSISHPPRLLVSLREFSLLVLIGVLTYALTALIYPYFNLTYLLIYPTIFIFGWRIISLYQKNQHALINPKLLERIFYFLLLINISISAYQVMLPYPPKKGFQYQQQALNLIHTLTQDGSTYVAGIHFLFDKTQPISGNSFLQQNTLYLSHPSDQLKPSLLPSLELDPEANLSSLIKQIQNAPVKIYVHTIFFDKLPELKKYMDANYEWLWGSIYIYSPTFSTGSHHATVKFSGQYRLKSKQSVLINHKIVTPESLIRLKNPTLDYSSHSVFRLTLVPDYLPSFAQKYSADIPERLTDECTEIILANRKSCIYLSS